jgi:hypothetical protein
MDGEVDSSLSVYRKEKGGSRHVDCVGSYEYESNEHIRSRRSILAYIAHTDFPPVLNPKKRKS